MYMQDMLMWRVGKDSGLRERTDPHFRQRRHFKTDSIFNT